MHWTEIAERRAAAGTGDVAIFDLHGQMTLSGEEEPRLLLAIRAAVQNGARHVLLNLTHVSYVDSTGIGEIVGAYTRVARHAGMRLAPIAITRSRIPNTFHAATRLVALRARA